MSLDNIDQLTSYIRGSESDSPESFGEKILLF